MSTFDEMQDAIARLTDERDEARQAKAADARAVLGVAAAFLRKTTPCEPYISNAIKRLEWWAERNFEGQP